MVGIDPNLRYHHLSINLDKSGVKKKRRSISGEMATSLQEEVDWLLKTGLVKESFYPACLVNLVLV